MQEESAALAAASRPFAAPTAGSNLPETQSFRPAGKGLSNLKWNRLWSTTAVRCARSGWSKRQCASTSWLRNPPQSFSPVQVFGRCGSDRLRFLLPEGEEFLSGFLPFVTLCVDPQNVTGSEGSETSGLDDRGDVLNCLALTVQTMILITILHNGTIISISYDYVEAGQVPEKWNLLIVCSILALLGGVACASSFLMLYMSLYTSHEDSILRKHVHVHKLS